MRKATEARDHRLMLSSIVEKAGVVIALLSGQAFTHAFEQSDTTSLQADVFGMFERHVGEDALDGRKLAVETFLDAPHS